MKLEILLPSLWVPSILVEDASKQCDVVSNPLVLVDTSSLLSIATCDKQKLL